MRITSLLLQTEAISHPADYDHLIHSLVMNAANMVQVV